jgi:hypothetical protein
LRSRAAIALLVLAGLACKPVAPPPLAQRDFGANTPCEGPTRVAPGQATELFLHKTANSAISPEAAGVPLFEMVSVATRDGGLVFSDVVHAEGVRQTYIHCKLDLSNVEFQGVAGHIGPQHLFTPMRDVLASLDTGFGAVVQLGGARHAAIFPPNYDTRAYLPFDREAPDAPKAAPGLGGVWGGKALKGANGAAGSNGGDGLDGRPGPNGTTPGMSGGDGGNGGPGGAGVDGAGGSGEGGAGRDGGDAGNGGNGAQGGNGSPGGPAGPGATGQRGEQGPTLEVLARPIQSPFYPGEELVYVLVKASWTNTSGTTYRQESLNYIFHHGQPFLIRSVGGDGGEGGDGGIGGAGGAGGLGGAGGSGGPGGRGGNGSGSERVGPGGKGGDGGNGGNGGPGGNGANGGCGGNGGNGGKAGDGGSIFLRVVGPDGFRRQVLRDIQLESVPGRPGAGGARGLPGPGGLMGLPGLAGMAGPGGMGGSGSTIGASGQSGRSGIGGSVGRAGMPPICDNRSGDSGARGTAISPVIREQE